METDEFAVGHFTLSNAKTIHAPVIQEAFINMECTLKETQDLSGAGIAAMVIGQVQHISVEKEYAQGYEQRWKRWFYDVNTGTTKPCHRGTKPICDCYGKDRKVRLENG